MWSISMTDFVNRDNLKSMIASKMAAFNNAKLRIYRAETEAIFASITQFRSECRMQQFIAMAQDWENQKSMGQLINSYMAEVQIAAALSMVNNFEAKVAKLRSMTVEYKEQARDEAFKLLDVGIDMMQQNLASLDQQIEECNDPKKLIVLEKQRVDTVARIEEANRIKDIEDPDEAMKQLFSFSKDQYKQFLQETTDLSEEEINAKLASVQPETEDVFGYFQATQGVWGMFKESINDVNNTLEQQRETLSGLKDQYSDLEEKKQALSGQKETIDIQEKSIKNTETYFDIGNMAAKFVSPALSPVITTGLNAAEKLVTADSREELANTKNQYGASLEKINNSEQQLDERFNKTTGKTIEDPENKGTKSEDINAQIQNIEQKQQSLLQQTEAIEQQQTSLSTISENISKIEQSEGFQTLNKKVEAVNKKIDQLSTSYENACSKILDIESKSNRNKDSQMNTIAAAIKDNFAGDLESLSKIKNSNKDTINLENLTVSDLTDTINTMKKELQEKELQEEQKKVDLDKEAQTLRSQAEQAKNDDILSKLSTFIKSNTTDDTKVVIDKSLSDIYSELSVNFGEDRVVIDKRNGDRRAGSDRRLEAKKATSPQKDNNNFFDRKDVAGRRTGDRRQSNHIFISQETINNLNLQS